jgi:hypothetical protein
MFEQEIETYTHRKAELLAKHAGKYALLFGADVEGIFASEVEAYNEGVRRHGVERFMVKHILSEEPHVQFVSFRVADDGERTR